MGRRLISLVAALAIGTLGALAFAAPGNTATSPTSVATFEWCEFPEETPQVLKAEKSDSQARVASILPQVLECIEVKIVDKCDGTTVVTLVNWAKIDASWTRLKVEILGVDYTVKGGPDHEPVVITLGPPGVEDVQAYLVFEGSHDGTSWRIEKAVGDPYSWELPEACPTVSPSPSATASPTPSPSVSTSTSAPATSTSPAVPAARGGNDLPVTGASLTAPLVTGTLAVLLGAAVYGFMFWRRRKAGIQA